MKKLLAVLSAGIVALMAVSCLPEEKAVFDETKITAPVLGTYNVGEDVITANYTPAKLELGFNESMAPSHTLAIVVLNGEAQSKSLTTTNDGATITLKTVNLAKALMTLGIKEGGSANVELAVRATIQDVSKDNGRNGYADSEKRIVINNFAVVIPEVQGNPWEAFTKPSPWGLIGSIASTGNGWNADEPMYMTEDGTKHVARAIKLATSDQFKVRKDGGWDTNFGAPGDTEPFVMTLGEAIVATGSGKNLAVPADGVYDLLLDEEAGTLTLTEAFLTYPGFDEVSTWSVIGAIPSVEMNWDKDIQMTTDGTWHVAEGVVLTTNDQFKFRKDCDWGTNIGATGDTEPFVVTLDEELSGVANGKNLAVPEDGTYDILVNPDANLYKVVVSLGGKSPLVGSTTPPEPPVQEVKGWNIIGLNGDWENDVLATEKDNVWTAFITASEATTFKWRKDGGWDENYGVADGATATVGTPFAVSNGGADIPVEAGFYKVELNLTNAEAPTVTIYSDFEIYSLIGDFNSWGGDVDMTETEPGIWVSPATTLTAAGFKIRSGHDWSLSYGGTLVELGVEFDAVSDNGPNIAVPADGEYIVTFNKNTLKIKVDPALPSNTWSLIGVNGDWNNDVFMTEVVPGVWVSPEVEITSAGWKVRFNHGWDVNRGGNVTEEGVFAKAVPGGENINLTGKFKVVYNANNETIGTLVWGVVGSITGWGADVPMNLASDGKWYSAPVTLGADDEIKIRKYAGWDDNFGGDFAEANATFAAVAGGNNIKAEGTWMVIYDPAAGTLALSNQFWGLIGDFNSWGGDKFMFFDGANWVAYGQTIAGGWKIRQGAGWDVNRGGVFAAVDTPFAAVAGGENINVGDLANFDVVYNPSADTFFIGDAANAPVGGPALFLNEFDTQNKKIEIYNAGDSEVDMTGWTLSKDETVWTIPAEHAKVPAKGYIVYTGKSDGTTDPTFGLSGTKGFLVVLKDAGGNVVDQVDNITSIVTIEDGKSWGRETDGADKFVIFDTPTIGATNGAAATITIDGNMADWAVVTCGLSDPEGVYQAFKVAYDADNLYFYSKRTWHEGLWKDSSGGYYYFELDTDNNPETGTTNVNGNTGYGVEYWFYLYLFTGTKDAPTFASAPVGSAYPDDNVISNITASGVTDNTVIETEVCVPRANVGLTSGGTIRIYTWGNKSAGNLKGADSYVLLTLK